MKKFFILFLLFFLMFGCSKKNVDIEVNTWSYGSDKYAEQYDASNLFIDDLLSMKHTSYSIIDTFAYAFVDEGKHQFLILNGLDGNYDKKIDLDIKEGKNTFKNDFEIIIPSSLLNYENKPYKVGDTLRLTMVKFPYDICTEEILTSIANKTEPTYVFEEIGIRFTVVGIYESNQSENIYTSLDTCDTITLLMRDTVKPIVVQFYDMTFSVPKDEIVHFKKEVNSLLTHSETNYNCKLDYQVKELE